MGLEVGQLSQQGTRCPAPRAPNLDLAGNSPQRNIEGRPLPASAPASPAEAQLR